MSLPLSVRTGHELEDTGFAAKLLMLPIRRCHVRITLEYEIVEVVRAALRLFRVDVDVSRHPPLG